MNMHETPTTIWDRVASQIPLIPDLLQPRPPRNGLLLLVNGYQQTQSYMCGAVSGFALAKYFRPGLRFETFCGRANPDPIWGTSPRRLAAALRKSGITVSERRRMTYRQLISALDGGSPVLVHTWIDRGEDLTHWAAAIGFDRRPEQICLMGFGYHGKSKEWFPRKDFERMWKRIGLICSA